MPEFNFTRLPASARQMVNDQKFFETIWRHVANQAEVSPFTPDRGKLSKIPAAAQAIYWLWRFQTEAGSGGLEVFAQGALAIYAREIDDALRGIRATDLVRRLESAIALARDFSPDFAREKDQSWFNACRGSPDLSTWAAIDRGVFPLVRKITIAIRTFAEENAPALFETGAL